MILENYQRICKFGESLSPSIPPINLWLFQFLSGQGSYSDPFLPSAGWTLTPASIHSQIPAVVSTSPHRSLWLQALWKSPSETFFSHTRPLVLVSTELSYFSILLFVQLIYFFKPLDIRQSTKISMLLKTYEISICPPGSNYNSSTSNFWISGLLYHGQ